MDFSCAFCREPVLNNDSELIKSLEERIDKKGDLMAMVTLASHYLEGWLAHDDAKASELLRRAADLGCPDSLTKLGYYFLKGELGLVKDEEKSRLYFEDATKKGDVVSRYNLGVLEEEDHKHDLAIKHFKLAAAAGFEQAMKELWKYFPSEKLTKAELEETLRAHKEACDEMNSEEREKYEACKEAMAGNDETLKDIYEGYYSGLMTAKELKVTLKAHGSGDVGQVKSFLSKCWPKASGS